ncbi:DoxX family protein [Patescibacteria group bacterium]|nr:DoxX family protein [Patescibacteria group bacterium]
MVLLWILRIIPALIVLQTLRYKFTGHPESRELFARLRLLGLPEQYGRIGTGVLELIFGVLILIPSTSTIGALGISVLMVGAMISHITKIGFKGNNLPLFISALIAFGCSVVYLFILLSYAMYISV